MGGANGQDAPEPIIVGPAVPTVSVEIELGGELKELCLRYDQLAAQKAHPQIKEAKNAGGDDESDEAVAARVTIVIAISLKEYLWPRQKELTLDEVLEGLTPLNMGYFTKKIQDLYEANGILVKKVDEVVKQLENPSAAKSPTRRSSGSGRKHSSGSMSALRSQNSGTPAPVS